MLTLSDFYLVEVLKIAKELLFELMSVPSLRYKQCIGPNKKKKDVHDMMKLLLADELSDVSIFLTLDITQIPQHNGEGQDLSSILRNIESIQSTVDLLTCSQKDLTDLVHSQINIPLRLWDGNNLAGLTKDAPHL